jgi:hypothetical protein
MSEFWPNLSSKKDTDFEFPELDDDLEQACPTCEDTGEVKTVGADVICTRCGTIVNVPLEWTAEYRWFSSDSGGGPDPSRCGFPINPLMPESSLGTMILSKGDGGSRMMRRIKRYHMWNLMPYRERTLWTIFESLQVRAANAGISTAVIEEAKELYAQLTASAICRGQNQRDAMLAACLWEALKRHNSPRIPKDLADIFYIPIKQVTRGIKLFQHLLAMRSGAQNTDTYASAKTPIAELDADIVEDSNVIQARATVRRATWQKTVGRTTTYDDFIEPFLVNLSTQSCKLELLVRHVCCMIEELGIVPENTPPSLVASVIAFCCMHLNINIPNADIAKVCGISPVTIQKCLKRLQPWKEKLLTI